MGTECSKKVIKQKLRNVYENLIVKLGSRSKVDLKSLIRDLDLELEAIIAMSPTTTTILKNSNFYSENI